MTVIEEEEGEEEEEEEAAAKGGINNKHMDVLYNMDRTSKDAKNKKPLRAGGAERCTGLEGANAEATCKQA